MRLDKSGFYHADKFDRICEIAFMIANQKKPHTISGQNPCVVKATQIILGEDAEQKMKWFSFSNITINRRINDIAADKS